MTIKCIKSRAVTENFVACSNFHSRLFKTYFKSSYDGSCNNSTKRYESSCNFLFSLINSFLNLIFFWPCLVFVALRGLSLVAVSEGYSLLQYMGFSLRCLLLWSTGSWCVGFSSCSTWALERRLSNCGL